MLSHQPCHCHDPTLKQSSQADDIQKVGACFPEKLIEVELLNGINDSLGCSSTYIVGSAVQHGIVINGPCRHCLGMRAYVACVEEDFCGSMPLGVSAHPCSLDLPLS
jgi:hypothetical protein